jgi:RNase P protein component
LGQAEPPWDLILIAQPQVLSVPFAERVRVLSALLHQAGVLGEKAVAV